MQPRYRTLLSLVPAAGLVFLAGCNNGGAEVNSGSSLRSGNTPPTTTILGVTPADATLVRDRPYVFTAVATDPDIGDSITQFEWDFGDGTPRVITTAGSATHVFTTPGGATVQARAYDTKGAAGNFASFAVTVDSSPSPITVTFQSPSAPVTVQADASGGVLVTFVIQVATTSSGTIGLSNITFNPGDANGSVVSSQPSGPGLYTFTVRYNGSSSVGSRTATPTVQVKDSQGVSSDVTSGPAVTINTLASANHAPVIVITNPATPTSAGFTTKPVNLGFTITDQDADVVTYTVDWGDGTPATIANTSGNTSAGVAVNLTHTYPDAFTSSSASATIRVNATDGRTVNGTAAQQTRVFTITYNTYASASITSPQASATLPSPAVLPSNPAIGFVNPPGPNDPDIVVIPSGGKVSFSAVFTPPGSGETTYGYSWTFQGGVPASSSVAAPGEVIFNANPGVITPLLAELKITDAFGRISSSGPGVNPKTFRKWIVVDGVNTQYFKLNFLYRLKADNNGVASTSPAQTGANGLGAAINIFQDGQTNTYQVQDQSGQAVASIPVRSNLPFYVRIPSFGTDANSYLLRVPNAPVGSFRDPSLGTVLASNASTFGFENTAPPYNPTLKIVTGEGFAPETQATLRRHIVGTTPIVIGQTPPNTRWIDRLAIPFYTGDSLGALNQWVQSNNSIYGFDLVANQSFAEWLMVLKTQGTSDLAEAPPDPTTTPGTPSNLGFVLNYPKYSGDTQATETFSVSAMQAFRVPGGVTDPYDITLAGSNNPSFTVNLAPEKVAATAGPFFNNAVFGTPGITPLAGGIQGLFVPYDANDPDRKPYKTRYYGFAPTRSIFSFSEYLWSKVWARPMVLNQASLNFATDIGSFPYYRRSNPAAWPKTTTGITPDNSQFDLTVSSGGTFDASSPVAIGGAPGTKGVGRFFWTAYTPFYTGSIGSAIARTWLADPTGQPPTSFSGTSSDATEAFGFAPPQDVVIDKRGRNANGSLNGSPSGGYRVTWFNPSKDPGGNPVPPDFWVVEFKTGAGIQHFMLPGSFPADAQSVTDVVLTDARTFLPSGRTTAQGPASDNSDVVGPGYCWFDIPVELRPTTNPAVVTVFAAKSILRNRPPAGARALNRPDWLDAIKTVTATTTISTIAANLDYVYKIPFNYYWDIVITNSSAVQVAP